MLETSNILNTRNNKYFSKNFKTITMSNQQVNIFILFIMGITFLKNFILYNLRDYARGIPRSGGLRYSPIFYKSTRVPLKNGVPVNKVFKRNYTVDQSIPKLDPYWVTGFVDAEGCFSVSVIIEDLKRKVRVSFEINLHEKDAEILKKIKNFFGVGQVYNRSDKRISIYRVTNVNYIKDIIIPHFREYPLISKKGLDFLLWSKVIEIILKKDHLSEEGFLKLLSYYASINTGVSKKVQKYYPNIIPADKKDISLPDALNPQWVSGFVAGDGGFSIYIRPAKDYVISEKVSCRFHIAQHIRDLELMKLFIKFFGCGSVGVRSNQVAVPRCDFYVQDLALIVEKILPYFDTYPLLNLKHEDYLCFKECVSIIKSKDHLTHEGLNKIKTLNLEMNSNRLK
jgi:hypothetical protein